MLSDKLMYYASYPVVRSYTGTMLKTDVQRHAQLPEGAKIIAANHPTTTDPFFVAGLVRQQSFIMINDLLFQVPVLGEYLRRSGHIPVKAGNGPAAIDAALEHLAAGHTVMIFPEGLISPPHGGFNKARTGVARLALASGAPVFPVGIHLRKERIRSMRSVVDGKEEIGHWYIRGPYNVTVGKPLRYNGVVEDHDRVHEVAHDVMLKIMRLAYESEQRWYRTNKAFPGACETV
jgi:1-acyl-sn-glycerol-3-phosphate acyltransferase